MNGLPFEFIIIVLGIFVFFFILIIALIIYARGEIYRFWTPPVPYFRRVKHNKPMRLKITRGVAQTLNETLVKIIGETIFQTEQKGNPSQTTEPQIREGVPNSLVEMWKKIREHPEKYTIWSFYFTRRWRTPQGDRGRWVFAYCLFSLEEITKRLGRHKLVQGVFLENPLDVHTPPTKEQWVLRRISEDRAKGLKPTRDRVKVYEKEYRRIVKEKWLNLVFHPTVTVMKEAEVMGRLRGFENLMAITAHAMNVLGTKLAEYEQYKHFALGREEYERQLGKQLHETQDKLGTAMQTIHSLSRGIKETTTPTFISQEHAPLPTTPFPQPPYAEKPSRVKKLFGGLSEVDILNWALIAVGLFATVFGYGAYYQNPKMWGGLAFGALMFLGGVLVLIWRKHRIIKIPETLKERGEEAKEAVVGE